MHIVVDAVARISKPRASVRRQPNRHISQEITITLAALACVLCVFYAGAGCRFVASVGNGFVDMRTSVGTIRTI